MRKGVLTKTSIKVLLSLLLLIGSFEPVVSASHGGSKPADVTFESYFPLREVLIFWLPNFAESIFYLAFLFPICLFEGKTQLLANSYMKALRGERLLCKVNLISVLLSLVCAFVGVYILGSIFMAVVLVPYVLAFRCFLLERSIKKILSIDITKPAFYEAALASVFMISCFALDSLIAVIVYAIAFLLYVFLMRKDIRKTLLFLKSR